MRMFDIHEDNWSLGFLFLQLVIHLDFNIVLTFEMEPKQGNVENVNWFKNEGFIFYWISIVTGCCCAKYAQLILLDIQSSLIFVR